MDYTQLKHVHIACASLSGSLFVLRGAWMLRASPMLARRWVRSVPHLVDTGLLVSALGMVVISGQIPFVQAWLGAKVCALLLYIVLGAVALKRGRTLAIRRRAFCAALAVFAYIVAVAFSKQALVFWPA